MRATAAQRRHDAVERLRHESTQRLRVAARAVRQAGRLLGPGTHPLPDFLVIGAQRCGTTSLYQDLLRHPQVREPLGKELHHFSLHHRRPLTWYRACFPALAPGEQTFEATPYYLFHPSVPARVAAALPQARFLVVLRDPVERAFSHYLHTRRTGGEPLALAAALDAEPARMERAARSGLDSRRGHDLLRAHSYVSRGRYAEQLRRWHQHVAAERILVLRTEELAEDPGGQFERITDFLGLEPWAPVRFTRHTRRRESTRADVPQDLRDRVQRELEPDVEDLLDLTGWDKGWW